MRVQKKHLMLSLSIGLLTQACGREPLPSSELSGYPAMGLKWDDTTIDVCFEDMSAETATERGWIKSRVTKEIQERAPVLFNGWGECPGTGMAVPAQLIRVGLREIWPATAGLGKQLNNVPTGMNIALKFTSILNSEGKPAFDVCDDNETERQRCIENIAVHEFGHALGMAHEQNRSDTNREECKKAPQGDPGDTHIGFWDQDSLMNYCNPTWNNAGRLSIKDVHTLFSMYPPANHEVKARMQFLLRSTRMTAAERDALGQKNVESEITPDRYGVIQKYQYGSMYWVPERVPFLVYGAINEKYLELGGDQVFGYPLTDELASPFGGGRYNQFEGGTIMWSGETGAKVIQPKILNKWLEVSGEKILGFPVSDEQIVEDGVGRYSHFQHAATIIVKGSNVQVVSGAIRRLWLDRGGAAGPIGYPVQAAQSSIVESTQEFEKARITFDKLTNRSTIELF